MRVSDHAEVAAPVSAPSASAALAAFKTRLLEIDISSSLVSVTAELLSASLLMAPSLMATVVSLYTKLAR